MLRSSFGKGGLGTNSILQVSCIDAARFTMLRKLHSVRLVLLLFHRRAADDHLLMHCCRGWIMSYFSSKLALGQERNRAIEYLARIMKSFTRRIALKSVNEK